MIRHCSTYGYDKPIERRVCPNAYLRVTVNCLLCNCPLKLLKRLEGIKINYSLVGRLTFVNTKMCFQLLIKRNKMWLKNCVWGYVYSVDFVVFERFVKMNSPALIDLTKISRMCKACLKVDVHLTKHLFELTSNGTSLSEMFKICTNIRVSCLKRIV